MRQSFQREWHNIQFSEIGPPSSTQLPTKDFYEAFYQAFFARYQSWEDLPRSWRQQKQAWADWLLRTMPAKGNILSVGCGIGFIEQRLVESGVGDRLYVQDIATTAQRWLESVVPSERRLIGTVPDCIPADTRFAQIFLAAVDYALPDRDLIALLSALRQLLIDSPHSRCVMISASFDRVPANPRQRLVAAARAVRDAANHAGELIGWSHRGQLWGWHRSAEEYRSIMRKSGFTQVRDGFISNETQQYFWILGQP